jgi:hypothetical protein
MKLRIGPMLRLKRFGTTAITMPGIECREGATSANSISAGCAPKTQVRPTLERNVSSVPEQVLSDYVPCSANGGHG